MARDLLRLTRVCAGHGSLQVLWDVDLHVDVGEYVTLLGANGSGKSTLLKVIAGLVRPTRGDVVLDGISVTGLAAFRRVALGVALVPEGRGLFAGMTVKENLLMGAYVRDGRVEVLADLDWVLTLFPALRERTQQIAGTLSGGEQQMCAIGRALMGRPRLLLIDELSFGLAPTLAYSLLEAVKRINREGTTVILVEQDVLAALRDADRACVVAGGRITREGTGAQLLADAAIQKSYLGR